MLFRSKRPVLSDALVIQAQTGVDARAWGYSDEDISRVRAAFDLPSDDVAEAS